MKSSDPIPDNNAIMLSGEKSLAESPMKSAIEAAAAESVETGWSEAKRLADLAKNFSRASTAAKALCGITLRHLREYYFGPRNPKGGRPKFTNLPGGKTPNLSGFSSWGEMLADRVGVTDDTATNWMKMADAVEGMAEAQGLDLQSICQKLPWDWTEEEAAKLDATVHKLTEDKTQRQLLQTDFLSSLGYVNKQDVYGTNNPTGKNGGKRKPAATAQELARERQEAARLKIFGTAAIGKAAFGSAALFMDNALNNSGRDIEALPQKEMRDFYELTVKPFAALIRKLSGL